MTVAIFLLTNQYYIYYKFFYQHQLHNYGFKKLSMPKMWEKNEIDILTYEAPKYVYKLADPPHIYAAQRGYPNIGRRW